MKRLSHRFSMEQILSLRVYKIVVGILGILGNGLVCLVIGKVSALHTRTNAFIFHQALVDFLGSMFILLDTEIPLPDIIPDNAGGAILCLLWVHPNVMFMVFSVSTYNLLAMTAERYFAIVHPFAYQVAFAHRPVLKTGMVIASCWTLGVIALLPVFGMFEFRNGDCLSIPGSNALGILVIVILYLAPVAFMLFAYIRTSLELKRGAVRVGPTSGQAAGMAESLLRARRNTFKTLLIVFTTFMICWTPNQVIFFMFNLGYQLDFSAWYYPLSVGMVATNSCINPIIYAFKYNQFRKGLRGIFCPKSRHDVSLEIESVTQSVQP